MRNLAVHIAGSHEEAEAWDIRQQSEMTPAERVASAWELALRVYGKDVPNVRNTRQVHIMQLFK